MIVTDAITLINKALTKHTENGQYLIVYYPNEAMMKWADLHGALKFTRPLSSEITLVDNDIMIIRFEDFENHDRDSIRAFFNATPVTAEFWTHGEMLGKFGNGKFTS